MLVVLCDHGQLLLAARLRKTAATAVLSHGSCDAEAWLPRAEPFFEAMGLDNFLGRIHARLDHVDYGQEASLCRHATARLLLHHVWVEAAVRSRVLAGELALVNRALVVDRGD